MDELTRLDSIPFDLVLSVGPACRPAQQIKAAGMRFTAAPMDWMELYPLSTVVHLFGSAFSDFFVDIQEEAVPHGKNRRVVDLKNQVTSIHHFPADRSLTDGQATMRKTMLKRYHRVDQLLKHARHVCLLGNRADDVPELLAFLSDFGSLYPQADFVFVNIRHTAEDGFQTRSDADRRLIEVFFRDIHPDGEDPQENPLAWHGNTPQWQAVLSHVHLSKKAQKQSENWLERLIHR